MIDVVGQEKDVRAEIERPEDHALRQTAEFGSSLQAGLHRGRVMRATAGARPAAPMRTGGRSQMTSKKSDAATISAMACAGRACEGRDHA